MNSIVDADVSVPAAPPQPSRVSWLFRNSLRRGQAHPLLHLVRRYRGDESIMPPIVSTPTPPAGCPVPPLARLPAGALSQAVAALPPLPQAVMEAVAATHDERLRIEDVARRVECDQSLVALTLRLANSAFFGVPGRVGSIADAIRVLGLQTLGALLTTAALNKAFDPARCPGFDFAAFWRHAVGSAIAARALAGARRLDPAVAFTAGLLHDVGKLALALQFPAQVAQALAWGREMDVSALEAETAVLGVDHAAAGASLATHWNFPPAVVDAIARHHAPARAGASAPAHSGAPGLAELTALADALVHALDLCRDTHESVPLVELEAWAALGIGAEPALALLQEIETGVTEICAVLGL